VLVRGRAWPDKCSDQPHVYTWPAPFIPPVSLFFPCLFLLKPPWSLLYPTSSSPPKHPIISLLESQNALSLHSIMCQSHTPAQWFSISIQKVIIGATPLTHGNGVSCLNNGVRFSWDSSGREDQTRCLFPMSHWSGFPPVFVYPCAPLGLWIWAFDGLVAHVMGLGAAWAGYYLGSLSCHCWSELLCMCGDGLFLSQNLSPSLTWMIAKQYQKKASNYGTESSMECEYWHVSGIFTWF